MTTGSRSTASKTVPLELYTVAQAAAALNVARMTVYNIIDRGDLPTVHLGRAVRIRPADLRAYIDAHVDHNGGKPVRQRRRKAS